jgi:hypothetical protein
MNQIHYYSPHDKVKRKREDLSVEMCYLYYQVVRATITKQGGSVEDTKFPTCPLLFLYGNKKNAQFHTSGFLAKISKSEGSRSKEMVGGIELTAQYSK